MERGHGNAGRSRPGEPHIRYPVLGQFCLCLGASLGPLLRQKSPTSLCFLSVNYTVNYSLSVFFLFCITTALIPSTFIARCQKHPATHHASTHQAAACRPLPAPVNEEVTLVKQPSSSAAAQHRGRRTQCHGWAAFSLSARLVRTSAHIHQLKAFPGTGPRDF